MYFWCKLFRPDPMMIWAISGRTGFSRVRFHTSLKRERSLPSSSPGISVTLLSDSKSLPTSTVLNNWKVHHDQNDDPARISDSEEEECSLMSWSDSYVSLVWDRCSYDDLHRCENINITFMHLADAFIQSVSLPKESFTKVHRSLNITTR